MNDRPFVRKGPRSKNVSDLSCVVTSVSWCIFCNPFYEIKRRYVIAGNSLRQEVMCCTAVLNVRECEGRNLEC